MCPPIRPRRGPTNRKSMPNRAKGRRRSREPRWGGTVCQGPKGSPAGTLIFFFENRNHGKRFWAVGITCRRLIIFSIQAPLCPVTLLYYAPQCGLCPPHFPICRHAEGCCFHSKKKASLNETLLPNATRHSSYLSLTATIHYTVAYTAV